MIYRVLADGVSIFDYDRPDMVLLDPVLETEANVSGSLDFTMPSGHVFYNNIMMLNTDIEVYEGDNLIWFGRPIEIDTDYYRQKKVHCEGALAFLNDTVQELHEYTSISIREFFRIVIENHNRQVEKTRQFQVGNITIPDKKVYRKLHYEQTKDVIDRQCIKAEGGYLFVRKVDGVNYIDWLADLPYTCNQPIEFGLNLLDIGSSMGGTEIATCVLPLGDENVETKVPLTVESVNGGSKIIESEAAKTYGKITRAVSFDGVTHADTLYRDGLEYLNNLQFDKISIECDASELHFINENYEQFRVGQQIRCISKPHLVDRVLPLLKVTINLDSATKKITLGTLQQQELTEIVAEKEDTAAQEDIEELQSDVENLQDNYDDLKDSVDDYISSENDKDTATAGDIESLSGEVDSLSGDIDSIKEDVRSLQSELDSLKEQGVDSEELESLKERVTTLEEDVEALQEKYTNLNSDFLCFKSNTNKKFEDIDYTFWYGEWRSYSALEYKNDKTIYLIKAEDAG